MLPSFKISAHGGQFFVDLPALKDTLYYEEKYRDPEGVIFDVSQHGWVTKVGQEKPFWQADSHRKSVYNQYKDGTVTFEFIKNYKFTVLNNENVWAKAMSRVVNDNVPVEKAVDEMVARIKQVAG